MTNLSKQAIKALSKNLTRIRIEIGSQKVKATKFDLVKGVDGQGPLEARKM